MSNKPVVTPPRTTGSFACAKAFGILFIATAIFGLGMLFLRHSSTKSERWILIASNTLCVCAPQHYFVKKNTIEQEYLAEISILEKTRPQYASDGNKNKL
jgi:hypothetical protein